MLGGLNSIYRMSLMLTADIRGFTTNLDRAQTKLNKFNVLATKAGASLTRGLGLAFGYVATQAVKAAAEFNRSNTLLRQIVGAGGIGALTDEANRLGRQSIFMATEVSAAQLELAKLGFRAEEINSVLGRTVKLATVFGTELDDTSKTIAATVRQFGLTLRGAEGLENVARVTDVMAAAFANSALDLEKFKQAMKNVGPTANATGLDLEKTTALLAVLANRAVDGSLGGTKLRSTLSDLAKQFPDVQQAVDSLAGGTLEYSQLVELLNKRAALIGAVFQDAGDEIEDFERILRAASGSLDAMNEGIEQELFFNVEKLKNAFNSISRDIGDSLAPLVQSLADAFDDLAVSVSLLDEETLKAITSGFIALAAIGPSLFVFGKVGTLIGQLTGYIGDLFKVISAWDPKTRLGTIAYNFAQLIPKGSAGAFTGVAIAAALAGNEVDKFFKRIQDSNRYFKKAREEQEALALAVDRTRKKYADLLAEETKRPSSGRAQLEQFTGATNAAKAQELLAFWLQRQAEVEEKISSLKERNQGFDKFKVESEKQYLQEVNVRIDRLNRLLAIYGEEEKAKINLLALDEARAAAAKQISDREREALNDAIKAENLRKVQESEPIRVPFANLAIEGLSGANQLAGILADALGGAEIRRGFEVLEGIQEIELPEEEFEELDESITKTANALVKLREGFDDLKAFAFDFADSFGQAFLQSRDESVKFAQAFKDNFIKAINAVIAKVITLIALYAILAIISGGTTLAGGQSFGLGFREFARSNPFGEFIGEGLGFSKMRASAGAGFGGGGAGGLKVMGAISGDNLVIMNQTGPRAYDRTFG